MGSDAEGWGKYMAFQQEFFSPGFGKDAPLVILLHGFRQSADRMKHVREAAREALGDCSIYVPTLPYSNPMSRAKPEEIAASIVIAIDAIHEEHGFGKVYLVGHSMGSIVARRIAVIAHGEFDEAPFEENLALLIEKPEWAGKIRKRAWADKIERLVLLAGMNRGWSTNAAQDWLKLTVWKVLIGIGELFVNGSWTVLQCRQGTPFVVQTRLQWLALSHRLDLPILVAQLLGSIDDTVAPDDTIDFAKVPDAGLSGESRVPHFVMLELPNTDHGKLIEMPNEGAGVIRRLRFQRALAANFASLGADDGLIPNQYISNGPPPVANTKVTDVVFVIHGIRDRGFWTQKVAIRVLDEAMKARREARSMTLSYGYLAMGPFVLPWVRREKVRWLMDRYADCRAKYPKATFHYVGHSNGTYLAARALQDYPAARFSRIVFAGSVVDPAYNWEGVIASANPRTDAVLNYVASQDYVVAIFPNGLSVLPKLDLGGAGHKGFVQLRHSAGGARTTQRIQTVPIGRSDSHEVTYVRGGHGAGIKESQWDDIAKFVVHGIAPTPDDSDFDDRQSTIAKVAGWAPPLSLATLALLLFGSLGYADWSIYRNHGLPWTLPLILGEISILWIVVTRV